MWRRNQDRMETVSANGILAVWHKMLGVESSEKRPVQDEHEERSLELFDPCILPLMSPPQSLQTERRSGADQRSKRLDREFCQEHLGRCRAAARYPLPRSIT